MRLEPNNAIALNNQGVIFESKDKLLASKNYEKSCLLGYETACKNFEKINGYSPKEKSKSVEKLLTEANLKFANRDWQSVIALTSKAIEIDPKNSEAYSTRSGAYANSGNLDAAKTDAELAIQYNPNNAVGFNNLGFVFEMRKDTKQSLLQYAIACNMKFELACSNLKRIKGN